MNVAPTQSRHHFDYLRDAMSSHWQKIEDMRQPGKIDHTLHDVIMSGFACMHFQHPSLLSFQEALEERQHKNNLRTLFNVTTIPSDSQMREVLDPIDTEYHRPIFKRWHQNLQRSDVLGSYKVLGKYYYSPMDGTQFFDSQSRHCHCRHCLVKRHQGYVAVILLPEGVDLPKKTKREPHTLYALKNADNSILASWPEKKKIHTKTFTLEQWSALHDIPTFPPSENNAIKLDKEAYPEQVEHILRVCGCAGTEDEVTYYHQVVQAAIVHPSKKQVLPLMPEFIQNEDGSTKQDCERSAAKRLVTHLRTDFPQRPWLIGGDALYANQPFIEHVQMLKMNYLVTVKFDDHRYLKEWLEAYETLPSLELIDEKGRKHRYSWQEQVPLHGGEDAIHVNYLHYELITTDNQGKEKSAYQSSWITDLPVNATHIQELVQIARRRWGIENECFNTCKNQGYHLEHNYGHGKNYLSNHFYLLTMLAFFLHQILFLTDKAFIQLREKKHTLLNFWNSLRVVIDLFIFSSWEHLINALLDPEHYFVARAP